jgi:uncharacterized small protein (DUF1192 family)
MDNDTAALMIMIELRQRIAALEAENAALREQLADIDRPPD